MQPYFDVESYSAQSFTKNVRTFFNKQQLNIKLMQQRRLSKIGSMPFEHAIELAKASAKSNFLSI